MTITGDTATMTATPEDLKQAMDIAKKLTYKEVGKGISWYLPLTHEDILAECYLWIAENQQHLSKGYSYLWFSMTNHLQRAYKPYKLFQDNNSLMDSTTFDTSAELLAHVAGDGNAYKLTRQQVITLIDLKLRYKLHFNYITKQEWRQFKWGHKDAIIKAFERNWKKLSKEQTAYLTENFFNRRELKGYANTKMNRYIKSLEQWIIVEIDPVLRRQDR